MEHFALRRHWKLAKQVQRISLLLGAAGLILVVGVQAPGLSQMSDPVLTIEAAATIQRDTAGYQQQLTRIRIQVHEKEALNNQIRQDTNRLVSLAEQYPSGERVVHLLLIRFEKLHRQRRRFAE